MAKKKTDPLHNSSFSDQYQEGMLVTSLIHFPEVIGEIIKMIPDPVVFQHEAIRKVYATVCDLYNEGSDIDEMSVRFHMLRNGMKPDLDASGLSLKFEAMTPSDLDSIIASCEGIISLYRRQITYKLTLKLNALLSESVTDSDLAGLVGNIYDTLTLQGGKSLEKTMKQAMDEMMADVDHAINLNKEGKLSGVPTGSDKLDRVTGGWQSDEIIILGGRPGSLKTGEALEFCLAAAENGFPVGYFSLEMKARKLVLRLVSAKTGIPYSKAIKGQLTSEEREAWYKAKLELEKLPIYFYDDVSVSDPKKMEMVAAEWARKYGIKLAIVDYLQLLQSKDTKGGRYEQITAVSISLKKLQLRLDIPMIVLAQLKREVDDRPDPRPELTDLKESGQIEQDASTVIMTFNPEKYALTDKKLTDENAPAAGTPFPEYGFYLYLRKRRSDATNIRIDRFADPATNRFSDTNIFLKDQPVAAEPVKMPDNKVFDKAGVVFDKYADQSEIPF